MANDDTQRTVPLFEEQLNVGKAAVVTDRLRISTIVEERPVTIDSTIERGDLNVERVAVERAVAQAPEPRQEGDILIVSIVEERLVVEKRLFVVEELRITRTTTTEQVSVSETVRTMRATIDRLHPASETTGSENNG